MIYTIIILVYNIIIINLDKYKINLECKNVAILPYYLKNALYNILDLFAKNFFGIFLSYILVFKKF